MTDSHWAPPASIDTRLLLPAGFRTALRMATGDRASLEPTTESLSSKRLAATTWPNWREAFKAQLGGSDLLIREVEADLDQAVEVLGQHTPLVTWSEDFGWLALLETDGGRVRIVRPGFPNAWVSKSELAEQVEGASSDDGPKLWIAIEAPLFGDGWAARPEGGPKPSPIARLMAIANPERSDVLAIFLYAAFSGLLSLAIPVAVQQLVNTVAFGGLVQPVVVLALLLLVGLAIAAALTAFQTYLSEILQRRIFVRACIDLAHRLPRLSERAFEGRSMPAYVNRFFDLVTLHKTGARLLLEGSGVILQTATGLLVLSFYHPLMLALSILLLGTMALVAFSFGRSAPETAIRESAAKYEIAAWMEELVSHPTAFRTSVGRGRAENRADGLIAAWVAARRQHYRTVFRQFVAALGLQVVVNTGLLALGGYLVVVGELTLGQLVASEIIVASVVASFSRLAKHFESFYDLLASVDKVGALFDLPLERSAAGSTAGEGRAEGAGRILCTDVSISRPGQATLDDFSLELSPGERVGLVSDSAMSRSLLFDVLSGVRAPSKGYVTLDGCDLRDLSPVAARDQISLIRSPQILPITIIENLTWGCLNADLEELQSALAAVGLLDEIRRLPDGLETRLDEHGGALGFVGAMRLEVARILLSRPAVILLDLQSLSGEEPAMAAALDALFDADAPWSLIAVATSPAIAGRCDRLVYLNDTRLEDAEQPTAPNETAGAPTHE